MNPYCPFVVTLAAILCSLYPAAAIIEGDKAIVYIGTFKRESSKGIYAWRLDARSGEMEPLGLVVDTMRPLFLALHPNRGFLYAVSRPTPIDRQDIGVVRSFAIDSQTGKLTELNSRPSRGIDPAYVSVDRNGKNLLVANFGSNSGEGCIAIFPINKDGSLAEASDFIQYSGHSVHPQRQVGPHSHAINVSPDNRFVLVADLGLDKIFVYRFDQDKGKLVPNSTPFAALPPGAGPRQFVFHPSGRFLYVINELQSTITTFAFHQSAGTLKELQTITTLPKDFRGPNTAAALQVHPNGKFLYGSNRGHDSIALFSIAPKTGMLTLVELVPTQGTTPGSFGIDPSGSWLVRGQPGIRLAGDVSAERRYGQAQSNGTKFQGGHAIVCEISAAQMIQHSTGVTFNAFYRSQKTVE